MTTNLWSDKIESLVPEFLREDYPGFVVFLQAYYEFLSQQYPNTLLELKDLDASTDEFLEQLRKDFAVNIPRFDGISTAEFLRNAKEFYTSRGSEASYHLLFRMMFGKEIAVFYPQTVMLRASDGRWTQDISFILDNTGSSYNTINDLVGNSVNFVTSETTLRVEVLRVKNISGDTWEIFIKNAFYGAPIPGDTVTFNGTWLGVIGDSKSQLTIPVAGTGNNEGAIYQHSIGNGSTIRIKLTGVNTDGSVRKAAIIQFGYLVPQDLWLLIRAGSDTWSYTDPTPGLIAGDTVIKISSGAINKYPGYFATTNGMLSDNMKIQDSYYYQVFSYVIKVDETINAYKNVVKNLLHPAGMALFGEFQIYEELDLTAQIEVLYRLVELDFQDDVLTDMAGAEDLVTFLVGKNLTDVVTPIDTTAFLVNKPLSDAVTAGDSGTLMILLAGDYASDYFSSDYTSGGTGTTRSW